MLAPKCLSYFFLLTLFLNSVLNGVSASAATFKVLKVNGHKAVVESSTALTAGEVYAVQNAEDSQVLTESPRYLKEFSSRRNSLSAGLSFSSIRGDSVLENSLLATGRYGWNFETFELGPLASYESIDIGAGTTQTFSGGVYADYNFTANKSPVDLIFAATLNAQFGSKNFAAGNSANVLSSQVGLALKWFMIGSSTALRLEGGYHYRKISSSVADATVTGFAATALISFYY